MEIVSTSPEISAGGQTLTRGLILLMSAASGMAVANLYYNQPLLADIGRTFHVSSDAAGLISMFTQIGYALGLFLFVPLGDIRERRGLITALLAAVTVSLIGVCTAQSITWIYIASLAVGMTTVVPQILLPLSAQMAEPHERGKVIGTVMSGLLLGILLARTVAGLIGGAWGWRTMYAIAAVLMIGLLIVLRAKLPRSQSGMTASYTDLIKSIGGLFLRFATLREAALIGAMMFGGFSVFWTSLAFFLEGSTYGYSSQVAGLFGLVGVVGASGAPVVGRIADRFHPKYLAGLLITVTLISYLFFGLAGTSLWGLIAGIILLDLGVQGTQVSNQARVYILDPAARSRLNTIMMVSTFIGGAVGSSLGSLAWHEWGWTGVSWTGGSMIAAASLVWVGHRLRGR